MLRRYLLTVTGASLISPLIIESEFTSDQFAVDWACKLMPHYYPVYFRGYLARVNETQGGPDTPIADFGSNVVVWTKTLWA